MNPLQRFLVWLTSKPPEPVSPFKQHMLQARQAQYAERYAEALAALDAALEIMIAEKNIGKQVDIYLSKADIFLYQQRYDDAEKLLLELRQRTEAASQRAPLAYTLCSLGALALARGQHPEAHQLFERAQTLAHTVRANGAEARAIAHLADTYLSEGNASYAIHLFREALPRLEQSGDTELQPYFMIRLAQALVQAGSEHEADGVLQAALDKTISLQQKRFQRLSHLAIGARAIEQRDFAKAQQHYESALTLYPEPAPNTPEYVTALCHLSLALRHQQHPSVAVERAQFALQCAKELADAKLIAQAQAYLGMAHSANGDYQTALSTFKTSLAFFAEEPAEKLFYFDLLREYAAALSHSNQPEAALATLQTLRQLAERDGLKQPTAHVYVEIGKLHEQQRQLKEALSHYLEALKLYEQLSDYPALAPLQCRIANLREQQGQGQRALRDYGQALERLTYIQDPKIRSQVQLAVALAYTDYGEMDSAEGFFKQALELAQTAQDKPAEMLCHTHYGRFLVLVNDVKPAITSLMEASVGSRSLNAPLVKALLADGLAQAFAQIEDTARALAYHEEALTAIKPNDEPIWAAFFSLNRAHTLRQAGSFDEAQASFTTLLADGRRMAHPHIIIRALVGLAQLEIHQQRLTEAHQKLTEALKLAENSYSRRLLVEVKMALCQQQAARGDLQTANTTWQETEKLLKILRLPIHPPEWAAQKT